MAFDATFLLDFVSSAQERDRVLSTLKKHDLDSAEVFLALTESELDQVLQPVMSLGKRKRFWNRLSQWRRQAEMRLWQKNNNSHDGRRKREKRSKGNDRTIKLPKFSDVDTDASTSSSSTDSDDDDDEVADGVPLLGSKGKRNSAINSASAKSSLAAANGHAPSVSGHAPSAANAPPNPGPVAACLSCLSSRNKKHGFALHLEPERSKTLLAFCYVLVVSWLTAFVMVIVHDRVPDMERYPPLPDLLLDNLPHIPWAFEMTELTGMVLLTLWGMVCFFHKHRFILMRRFFSISGTIFLLRCVTMLITSLSVPGRHLECSPRPYGDIRNKLYNAYVIWTGAGMTLQGVRTCGDYMFSGHTVTLTLLNFFITEYTSRRVYFLHTFTWICNVFGVFFILAAHEHYSIDVFVAFYITSRLFLYYHTLANNKSGSGKIGQRNWFYFPLFYFFESRIDGKVPNEFEWPLTFQDVKYAANRMADVFKRPETAPKLPAKSQEKNHHRNRNSRREEKKHK